MTDQSSTDPVFDQLLAQEQERARRAAAGSVAAAADKSPDEFAAQRRLASYVGVPPAVAEILPQDIKRQATVQRVQQDTVNTPVLAQRYTDADFAKLAHDDSGSLSSLESLFGGLGAVGRYLVSADDDKGLINDVKATYYTASRQAAGLLRAGTELAAIPLDPLENYQSIGGNPLRRLAEGFGLIAEQSGRDAARVGSKWEPGSTMQQIVGGGVSSGVQSFIQSGGVGLAAAWALGPEVGIPAALLYMAASQGGDSYQKAREKGVGQMPALAYGAEDAVAEYVTERFMGLGGFLERAVAGASATKLAAYELFKEIPGEIGATLWQNFNEWSTLNPEKSLKEFLTEQPAAIAQTVIATLVGGGGNIAANAAVKSLYQNVTGGAVQVKQAEEDANRLAAMLQVAAAAKLRERAPDTFSQFVQQAGDENNLSAVYIDARTLTDALNQAGIDEAKLASLLPSVPAQLQEALTTGGDIEVPIGEALAALPGTGLEEVFLQNARTSADGISRAQAEEVSKQSAQFIQDAAARVLAQAQDAAVVQESADKVKQTILDQLNAAKRFTPDVHDAYATLVRDFYIATAGRLGVMPGELYARYPLRVASVNPLGEQLNREDRPSVSVEGVHFSNQDRSVLSTAFYGTGLKGSARDEILSHPDTRLHKRLSFYFDKGTGISPEAGVGGRAHRVQLTNLYDANADPLMLRTSDARMFESKLLDLGYSGYLDRLDGDQPGQVVVLGDQAFVPDLLGGRSRIAPGEKLEPIPRAEPVWTTQAGGTPEQLQARLERMQSNPAWSNYDLRIEGNELQVREKAGVLNQAVSTRVPTATPRGKNAPTVENPLTERLQVGLDAFKAVPDALDKAVALLVTYPNWQTKTRLRSTASRVEKFIGDVVDNLLWLHDQIPAEIRARSKKWYDGAHVIANTFADRYGVTLSQASAVLAVNSPQTEWFTNVSRAERILDAWFKQQDTAWSPEMEETASRIFAKEQYAEDLAAIRGKTLRDLDGDSVRQAMWIRAYDESHNDRGHRIVTPEGAFGDWVVNADGVTRTKTAWASLSHIAKSIEVLRDGSLENVSLRLGNEHKVRSFYNNIFAPADPVGDVTIDTHAVAAGLLRPLSGSDIEVVHNLGGGVSNALKGLSGTYGIYAEAYRRAAAERGLLPREMQSITWEAIRGLYTDVFKSSPAAAQVEELWQQYRSGKLTEAQVRERALEIAGGINEPNWWQSDRQPPTETWTSSYGGELSEFRVPGPAAGTPAGGDQAGGGSGGGAGTLQQGGLNGRPEPAGDRGGRYARGGLAPLEGAPAVAGASGPDPRLVAVAEQYARDHGIDLRRQGAYVQVDPVRAARIAGAYDAMAHAPQDPKVREAYQNLIKQTIDQYLALQRAGYKFWFMDPANDPYQGNPWNAMRDLRQNQSMAVFPTEEGFGSGATELNVDDNPLLADTGLEWPVGSPDGPMKRVLANDLFRAVHDAFGHGLEGAGFRAQGEENAWQAHVRLFTGSAIGAITSETRGQNSWLNYGPYGEQNRNAKVEDTVFADQKTGLMPEWTWTDGRAPDMDDVLEQSPSQLDLGSTEYTDPTGERYQIRVSERRLGADGRTPSVFVEAYQGAERRGVIDFSPRDDGVLTAENTKVADAFRKRGIAEAMYRAARGAGFDIAPGRVQTDKGLAMVEALQRKGVINKEAIGPRFRAGDLPLMQGPRGTFSPSQLQISLLENADLSTFLHETGHFFLEVMADLASQPNAPAPIAEDMAALLKWFGVTDLYEWNTRTLDQKRPYHEKFAEAFEQYLFEGKAPSAELRPLFSRFRSWMISVYRSLKDFMAGHKTGLTDEVRGVFDRLIATEEQIAEAERLAGYEAVYKSAEEAGMTPEEWTAYQEKNQAATDAALDKMQARSLRDMKWAVAARSRVLKELQAGVEEKRKAMRAEVTAEVRQQPVYAVQRWLKTGVMPDGSKTEGAKLSTVSLKEMYGDGPAAPWRYLSTNMLTNELGLAPDVVAEMFGFTSGDQMVREIVAAFPEDQTIDGMTEQRLLEQYGDAVTKEGIERAASEAVHNEARARFVATELATMQAAMSKTEKTASGGRVNVMLAAARQFAENIVNRTKLKDLKPGKYTSAEARAGRLSAKAQASGDQQAAVQAKRDQLLNGAAARLTMQTQREVERGIDYLKKFDKESVRKNLPVEYLDQIDKILERVELRRRTERELDKREKLADWIKSQEDLGIEPTIPEYLREDAQLTNVRQLTVEEFRGLIDTVKQVEHLGRLKERLLTAKDKREFAAVVQDLVASINDNAGERVADTRTPADWLGRTLKGLRAFGQAHIKAATLARIFDGGQDGGPVWERLIRPANEAGDRETTMRAAATKELSTILEPWLKQGGLGGKGKYFPLINRSLNREQVLAIALNTGNEGNLQRLLGGEGWNNAQLQSILQSLTPADWQTVQKVWDYFETFRPQVGELERRVFGREPEWVKAGSPVTEALGIRGGYYPVKYDPAASVRAEEHADAEGAKRQLQGAYGASTVRKSFTKARAEKVEGRPLLYTLAGVYTGVNDTIHYLAWQEWLIDANRLLKSKAIDGAIRSHYGPEAVRQFKTWRDAIAEGEAGSQEALDRALGKLRQSVSVAGLGFNVMSALLQPLGLTQSIVRVGAEWIGKGAMQYIANPRAATKLVKGKSEFMENRTRTRFRELNELRNRVEGQTAAKRAITDGAYFLMMQCQQMVDVPTWIGAYEKAIADGNSEDRAIALADQAVIDSQGGGQTKDLSAIERGGPAQKLFTVFYSFMNTALNLGVGQTATSDKTPAARAKLAADYALLFVVPAVLGAVIKDALTPGDSGDYDDWKKLVRKLLGEQLTFLLGLMVVAREFGEAGKTLFHLSDHPRDYQGPAGVRLIADTGAAAKQAAQGEFDDAFRKAAVNLTGDLVGLPAAQINRSVTGAKAIVEGKTKNPAALVLGYQEPR